MRSRGRAVPSRAARVSKRFPKMPLKLLKRAFCPSERAIKWPRHGPGTGAATAVEWSLNHAQFGGRGARTLEVARTLRAELIPFNRYGGAFFVAADHASVDHQLHRTGVVQQNRPAHG